MENGPRHQCLVYAGAPSEKLPSLAATIRRSMNDGFRCLYLNSAAMVAGMKSSLASLGLDVELEISRKRLVLSSEPVTQGDDFNITQMLQNLEGALDEALADGFKGLWVSGDITWELGPEKNFDKIVEYEWKLEELFKKRKELYGVCQYHRDTLPDKVMRRSLLTHRTVFLNETLSRINPLYVNSRFSSESTEGNVLLDKMVAELCQSNFESCRRQI